MARGDEKKAGDQPQTRRSRSLLERPSQPERQRLKMNKEQFKNEVLALVSEDALPMVDALTEQGFAEGWTPAEVAGQCEADA